MIKLNKATLIATKLACFSLLILLSLSCVALAQTGNPPPGPAPDTKIIFENQAPFTEKELTAFLVDFPKARGMKDKQQAVDYLSKKGWTPGRLTYVAAKVSVTREIVRRGSKKEVINNLPKEAQPQKGELALVEKYQKQIDAIQ